MGEMTDKAKAAVNKAAGSVKESIGKSNNDPDLQAEGEAQKAKGDVQDVSGTVKGKMGNDI